MESILAKLQKHAPDGAFGAQAHKKAVLTSISNAYERAKHRHTIAVRDVRWLIERLRREGKFELPDSAVGGAERAPKATRDLYDEFDVPDRDFNFLLQPLNVQPPALHAWKPKHAEQILEVFEFAVEIAPPGPELDALEEAVERFIALADQYKDLRDEVAAMPVERIPAREENPGEIAVRGLVKDIHEKRMAMYLNNVSIGEELYKRFGVRLRVGANSHYVRNAHGTTFMRTMYYLNGERQSLAVIVATMEKMGAEFGEEYWGKKK